MYSSWGWESLYEKPMRCPSVFIQEFYSNMYAIDTSVPPLTTVFMVWGDTLNFSTTEFAKGLRILIMLMTIVLTPRSHYNTITEPRAHFLLSLQEDLFIDFPSHMIVSMIDIFETLLQVISSSFLQLSHAFSHTCMSPFLLLLSFTP